CLFEQASAREEIGAEEYGGPGRGGDFARCIERRGVGHTAAGAPRDTAASGEIECGVEGAIGAENFPGSEGSLGRGEECEVVGREFDIGVEDRDPFTACFANATVDGGGEPGVAAHPDDACAASAGKIGRAIGGAVIDGDNFGGAERLCVERIEQAGEMLAAVPHGHNGADAHRKKRFLRRKARLANPSRQALSLVSPRREEYMMEISPKRMRGVRRASILISSL